MFELADLEGLLFVGIYKILDADTQAKFELLKGEVDQTITRHTGYTNTEISNEDYADVKKSIKGPYAHILEHLALSYATDLPDLQLRRISESHRDSMRSLAAMPRYNPTTGVASRVVSIEGAAEW